MQTENHDNHSEKGKKEKHQVQSSTDAADYEISCVQTGADHVSADRSGMYPDHDHERTRDPDG